LLNSVAVALPLAGFVGLTAALAAGALLDVDIALRNWCDTHRPAVLRPPARALNFLGSANLLFPLLLALAAVCALRQRSPRLVLSVVVTFAASYLVVVPLKMLTDRAAPRSAKPAAVELFANDAGWSYPSGHVFNAVIWYPVLLMLLDHLLRRPLPPAARTAILVVPVVTTFVTVTYLSFHWITDAIAGVLLGIAVQRLLRLVNDRAARGPQSRPPSTRPLGERAAGAAEQPAAVLGPHQDGSQSRAVVRGVPRGREERADRDLESRTRQMRRVLSLRTGAVTAVGLVVLAGCASPPAGGPSSASASPPPVGDRVDVRRGIQPGFMLYEDRGGPGGGGSGQVPPCFGRPLADYGIGRFVDERSDRPIVRHQLFIYSDVATSASVFAGVKEKADDLGDCIGHTDVRATSVGYPSYGAEAVAATIPIPADGAGEHTGEPLAFLVFRVGSAIMLMEASPGAGPADTERRGEAAMKADAQAWLARLCLYDPECGPRPGLPAPVTQLRNGGTAWAAALGVFKESDSNARPGAWVASAAELGYRAGIVPVACDVGAGQALGVTGEEARHVAVYFGSRADAQAFAAALPNVDVRILNVTTFCVPA
jgi:membrane-associated phospholipid phosphatase